MKLVGELKPEKLQHDSMAGDLRVWRNKFESYYTASNMHLSRLNVQQAHLLNCLDRELSLDSSIQATTPVMGNGVTCLSILTGIFEKKYPVLLRRKNFFSMAQQAEDERSFAEAVNIAANESDIAGMTLQNAMCLVILTCCKDTRLKEKMSELETPTLAAFNILIDAHMHTKATSAKPASSCGAQANRQKSTGRGSQNSGGGRNTVSDAEKKRRQVMKGKCFRCGSADHFANGCSLAKDIKCKRCNVQGHIANACTGGGNNSAPAKANAGGESESQDNLLQLEYRLADCENKFAEAQALGGGGGYYYPPHPIPFSGNGQGRNNNAQSCAITQNTDCNRPTPNMLL